jgi:hypothetical protein
MRLFALLAVACIVAGCAAGDGESSNGFPGDRLEDTLLIEAAGVGVDLDPDATSEELVSALLDRRAELLGKYDNANDVYPERFLERIFDRRIESALRESRGLPSFVTESGFPSYMVPEVAAGVERWRESIVSLAWEAPGSALEGVTGVIVASDTIIAEANGISTSQSFVRSENAPLPSIVRVTLINGETIEAQPQGIVRTGYEYFAVLKTDEPLPFSPLPIAEGVSFTPGDALVTIGHPSTVGRWVATLGIVEEVWSYQDPEDSEVSIPGISITNPYWIGMQGSVVVSPEGELVAFLLSAYLRQGMTSGGPAGIAPTPVGDFLFPSSPYISQNLVSQAYRVDAVIDVLEREGYL